MAASTGRHATVRRSSESDQATACRRKNPIRLRKTSPASILPSPLPVPARSYAMLAAPTGGWRRMLGALLKNLLPRGGRALARAAFEVGVSASQKGEFAAAAERFEQAISLDPQTGEYHFLAGVAWLRLGELDRARSRCRSALELDPTIPGLHMTLARMEMPGPYYVELLKTLHEHLRPRTYIEVGVETGQTL